MPNLSVPAAATGLPANLPLAQAINLYETYKSLEETLFAMSRQECMLVSDDQLNAAGNEIEELRSQVGHRMDALIDQIRSTKPGEDDGWRRMVLLVQYEAANDFGLLRCMETIVRQRHPDIA